MGLRITTWNVNGIRNPFGYQPWRDKRSFAVMFDILEADIVVFQETKIQRKDLTDDMVLVPGWDCYFSLPRHKKGYSGVVIYTRQSVCAPIRAEEGITGTLCPPNSSHGFCDLPIDQQIGGYPTPSQLAESVIDATTLDSEGRCVILEFPAFVLLGVYSPANRDETRDDFRLGFLDVLDSRIRNLISMGKQVFLTGDLNISREELDAANAESSMRKQGLTGLEFVSTPARRLFNQLLEDGKVFGDRDEGREVPVLWDICRGFHPDRKGMFTCWEQKVNARPGNCGARIDYVLCSLAMKSWFLESNIQEGLMGSDHCPVYAVMKEKILLDGQERDVQDVMNPHGMFLGGCRQREYSTTSDPLPMSGKLIPEFFGRRNIRDMFSRKTSSQQSQSIAVASGEADRLNAERPIVKTPANDGLLGAADVGQRLSVTAAASPASPQPVTNKKRGLVTASAIKTSKRSKSGTSATAPPPINKGQQSLKGFFKAKPATPVNAISTVEQEDSSGYVQHGECLVAKTPPPADTTDREAEIVDQPSSLPNSMNSTPSNASFQHTSSHNDPTAQSPSISHRGAESNRASVHDPIEAKESWSKLFVKPAAPRCEGHDEPCITLLTKKPGMNLGRSFWMCSRPLGPSGAKEKNTQWRCQTFIWCSDWNSTSTQG